MDDNQAALANIPAPDAGKLTKTARHAASAGNARPVPHWGINEVLVLVKAARQRGRGRKGDRDALLIQTIFDGALRKRFPRPVPEIGSLFQIPTLRRGLSTSLPP